MLGLRTGSGERSRLYDPVQNEAELVERIRCFLANETRGGPDIVAVIAELQALGEVAIFGGMARDLARGGSDTFASDVDLVVAAAPEDLGRFFSGRLAELNRFGGYRLRHGRHVFDIWALQSTWAVSAGHVRAHELQDLVHTTFFTCDAVMYLCSQGTVCWTEGHQRWLKERLVDINLEANPNPDGAVARTLRILNDWGDTIGPDLARFLDGALRKSDRDDAA